MILAFAGNWDATALGTLALAVATFVSLLFARRTLGQMQQQIKLGQKQLEQTQAEIELVKSACARLGVQAVMADHWAEGGKGAADVARTVVKVIEGGQSKMKLLYPDDMPLLEKIRTIAKEIYRASDISVAKPVRDQLASFEAMGYRTVPVCIAKTQYSFSTNPDAKGAPDGHTVAVREVRLSAGAEFVVAVCGDIMTMPGLPKTPAADSIDINAEGKIVGLF